MTSLRPAPLPRGPRARRGLRAAALLSALALGAPLAATASASAEVPLTHSASLVVRTTGGAIRGKAADSVHEFLGIPYAAPPAGALRWKPPAPAARWRGVREATQFGPNCAQPSTPFGMPSTSEDCLYLNVFAPSAQRSGPLPVMVWIHGGAYISGESNDFDPTQLVDRGVIVVSVNYRLGALGFLAASGLAASDGSAGDYGLMDQQAALRWVHANIGRFGGDPRDVTLFGESAGGQSVLAQLASPGARGLFSRAIVESGAYTLKQTSLSAAEESGANFATSVGCAATDAACLRAVPVATLLAKQNENGYRPDVDGRVLTQTLDSAFSSGQFARVPVVIGSNHDEYRLFVGLAQLEGNPPVSAANYVGYISALLGVPAATAAAIASEYPLSAYPGPALALGAVGTDAVFACNSLAAADELSKYVPTYAYEFNDASAPERNLPSYGFPYGAAHASELQYLFDLTAPIPGTLDPAQQRLAAEMKDYWTGFARRGVPTVHGQVAWPAFDATSQTMLSLNTPAPAPETGFATGHHCAAWPIS
jgi:para-nitrobenzyl esterase